MKRLTGSENRWRTQDDKDGKSLRRYVCAKRVLHVYKSGNQKEHYADMAEHPPDRKASEKFHRPAYQAGKLIEAQGQQLWHGDVAEYLARKYKIGDDANGEETGREQCEERE